MTSPDVPALDARAKGRAKRRYPAASEEPRVKGRALEGMHWSLEEVRSLGGSTQALCLRAQMGHA